MPPETPRDDTDFLRRVDALFERALDLDEEARSSLLDTECAGDPSLRERVDSLLEAVEQTQGRISPGRAQDHGLFGESEAVAPRRVGYYELIEEAGRGGMGVVYRARRADGTFEQTVAVKILRSSAGASTVERFARERQILATLDHANIARLFDGGVTEDGRPYLVVEFVEGRLLDEVCQDQSFDIEGRLRLLIKLCDAVDSAHRRLVVHRDIKPGNILVRADGEPKLLDFGIAKLLDPGEGEVELTRAQQRVMTLQYASPEQVRGTPVTVASDVYQLGLVAYEVLCGVRPYELHSTPPATAERLITEEDPPPPSSQVSAERRRGLRGDLDLIVMKTLRKEPERRYSSAAELRHDLRAYLEGRPVHARPSTWSYRASKFVRRNAASVTVAAVMAGLLIVSTLLFTRSLMDERDRTRIAAEEARAQERIARGALDEAERSLDFFVELLSWEAGPQFAPNGQINVSALLDRSVERIERTLADHPRARARTLWTVGTIAQMWGDLNRAQQVQSKGVQFIEERLAEGFEPSELEPTLAQLLLDLGDVEAALGRGDQALELQERGLELARRWFDEQSSVVGGARMRLAVSHGNFGSASEALAHARAAVEALQASRPADDLDIVSARRVVGDALVSSGHYGEAREHLAVLVAELETRFPDSLWLAGAANGLGNALALLGDFGAAVSAYETSVRIGQALLPEGHLMRIVGAWGLGDGLREAGRAQEAVRVLDQGIEEAKAHGITYFARRLELARAAALAAAGRSEGAVAGVESNLDWLLAATDGASSRGGCEYDAGRAMELSGRFEAARGHYSRSVELIERERGADHASLTSALLGLARIDAARGRWQEASASAERAFILRDRVMPVEVPARIEALDLWIEALNELGETELASQVEDYRARHVAAGSASD